MQDDLEGIGVGGDDNQLGDTPVKGLGCFIGPFLDLL